MRRIVYDVALTLDNFLCSEDGGVEDFLASGPGVDAYFARLQTYDTVLMGRRTYEFGYAHGLEPGQRAYPHMEHYLFSDTLSFDGDQVHVVEKARALNVIDELKGRPGSDIYLCGGGAFAGFLLDHGRVDRLVVKLNPILLGSGIRAFGESRRRVAMRLIDSEAYGDGLHLLRYDLDYGEGS